MFSKFNGYPEEYHAQKIADFLRVSNSLCSKKEHTLHRLSPLLTDGIRGNLRFNCLKDEVSLP